MRDLVVRVADEVGLSQLEREQLLPSGGMTVITNRVHWARTYLKQAGLVESPRRGYVQITQSGRDVLARNPAKIDALFLQQFEEFRAFLKRTKTEDASASLAAPAAASSSGKPIQGLEAFTPEEQITSASLALNESLREALLSRILEGRPAFF